MVVVLSIRNAVLGRWGLRAGFGAMSPSAAWFKRMEREWKIA